MKKNYQLLKSELLESLLKNKNTSSLSKKMGYRFDKVARWKNGTKQLKWNEFYELCLYLRIPLHRHLAAIGFAGTRMEDSLKIVNYFKKLYSEMSTEQITKMLNISSATFHRHVNLHSYPEIEIVFELMDIQEGMLFVFLNDLAFKKKSAFITSFTKYPWMPAVANAMLLKQFRNLPEHSSEWIANYLGLSVYQVEIAISEFVNNLKIIEKIGPHYVRTQSAPKNRTVPILGLQYENESSEVIRYWTRKILQNFEITKQNSQNCYINNDRSPYRIFSCGPKNTNKINEIIMKAEKEIHDLLTEHPEEPTDVRVLLFHHVSASVYKKK